jgi:hypothetical protein
LTNDVIKWQDQVDEYLRLAHEIGQSCLIHKYRRSILDYCLRGASDIISCENLSINNNTASMLQWCKRWTHEAMDQYWITKDLLTEQRNGKPPTHRQIVDARGENGKRFWTVEHEHPLLIAKTGLMEDQWSFKDIRSWMFDYGYATIVTQKENKRLLKTTKSMEIAEKRYSDAGMYVVMHPEHERRLDAENDGSTD